VGAMMDQALDANESVVSAGTAEYGIYFCTECKKLSYLRKPVNAVSHFYHYRFNPACSLCTEEKGEFLRIEESNKAKNTLLNSTKENWCSAINCLIRNNHLYLLDSCEFAIKPICFYINNRPTLIDKEVLLKLFLVLMSIKSEQCIKTIFEWLFSSMFSESERLNILNAYLKTSSWILPDSTYEYIFKKSVSLNIVCDLYPRMTKQQKDSLQSLRVYRLVSNIYNLLESELTYDEISLNYNVLRTQDRKQYSNEEWISFLVAFKRKILFGNYIILKDKLVPRIDKDIIKAKNLI
jgi:hypothetical protein